MQSMSATSTLCGNLQAATVSRLSALNNAFVGTPSLKKMSVKSLKKTVNTTRKQTTVVTAAAATETEGFEVNFDTSTVECLTVELQ